MLGGPDAWEPVAERLRHVFGIANFSRAALVPLDVDGIAKAILEDLGDHAGLDVPRLGQARRQAISADVAADRARGRRAHQGSEGMDRRSRQPRVHDSRRGAHRRGVLSLREGSRPGRHADGRQRPGRRAALGRHRLAGGLLSPDEARMPRHPRALSQLSDSVARVAGKGARAGGAC